jgi:DNA replication protein DnaC
VANATTRARCATIGLLAAADKKDFTTAILDRVLHHAVTVSIRGESYRLKEKLKAELVKQRI